MRVVPAEDTPHLEADGKKLFQILDLLRGEIGVESEVDRGSTFSVRFPRRFEEDEAAA